MNRPTRADFVKAARIYALAYGRQDDAPGYLPRTDEAAAAFEPHAWVIGAMIQAFEDGVKDGRDAERADASPGADVARLVQQARDLCVATLRAGPGVAVEIPPELAEEGRKFMRGELSLIDRMPFADVQNLGNVLNAAVPNT